MQPCTRSAVRQRNSFHGVVGMDHSLLHADSGFTFGNLRLEPDGTLLRGNEAIHLAPKELAALRVLLSHPGHIVTPAQLKESLWPDVHVTADSVPRCISSLRARLGSEAHIRTIYKMGYRFESSVHRLEGAGADDLPGLAIVPFTSGFGIPNYLGAAIAEDAGTHLLALDPAPVRLLPRDSVFALADTGISPQELGQRLGADLVLTGVIQASTLFLRVRSQMLRVSDGSQIWVEEAMGPRDNYAIVQHRLLDRLTYRLGVTPAIAISATASDQDENNAAVQAFLQGRFEGRSRDAQHMSGAVELLFKACDADCHDRASREQIVKVSIGQCLFGYTSPAFAAEQIRRASDDLDQPSAAVLSALGWTLFHVEHNLPFALRMVYDADPEAPGIWPNALRVLLALSRHRFAEALEILEGSLRDDPWSPALNVQLAWAQHLAGHAPESLQQAEICLEMFSGDERAELCAALILAYNNEPERAARLAHKVAHRVPALDIASAIEAYALARAARRLEATTVLERLQFAGHERFVLSAFTAAAYAELGDTGAAITELQVAEKARCPWFFQTLADPRLQCLHGHPEFRRMRGALETMEAAVAREAECMV